MVWAWRYMKEEALRALAKKQTCMSRQAPGAGGLWGALRLHPKAGITRQGWTLEEGFKGQAGQARWGIFRESPGTHSALRWRQLCIHM